MEGEVVDDDGPHGRLSQHAAPGGGWGAPLLFRFSRSQWYGGQPAVMHNTTSSGSVQTDNQVSHEAIACFDTCSPTETSLKLTPMLPVVTAKYASTSEQAARDRQFAWHASHLRELQQRYQSSA